MTDEQPADEKSPVEQALELLVFAPLGLAMTARTQLPEMVAKGRAQVENQISVARFIGQFAVQHGRAEVEKRVKAYTEPGPSPEAARPGPEPAPPAAEPREAEPEAATPQPAAPEAPSPEASQPEAASADSAPEAAGSGGTGSPETGADDAAAAAEPSSGMSLPLAVLAQPAPEEAPPGDASRGTGAPRADDLAIHGYDALSASQVVQRLAGLSPAELEQVRAYEAATRGRKTVLTKIAQLQ